jgi:hypothetical protein
MKILQEIMPEIVHLFDKTLGCVMAFEGEYEWDEAASGRMTEVLLIFCPAGETDKGCLEVSPRMKDLACMGFNPAALVRANSKDHSQFAIYALPDLPGRVAYAISKESERLVLDAMVESELNSDETGTPIQESAGANAAQTQY